MPTIEITEHTFKTDRHESFYLACGPEDGPPMVFVHGWPELSLSWRHLLRFFGAMGMRAIAPDQQCIVKTSSVQAPRQGHQPN